MGNFTGSMNVTRIFRYTPLATEWSNRHHIRFAIAFARLVRISYRRRRAFRHAKNCLRTALCQPAGYFNRVNANLIARLRTPSGLAIQGKTLFVANESGSVGKYDAVTGAAINPNFITGMRFFPQGLAIQGNILFVANFDFGTVGKYDATTGKAINPNFITGAGLPTALALSADTLFVANQSGTVGKYDATTGEAINPNFITGLQFPTELAVKSAR
jgi:hypothetical protein